MESVDEFGGAVTVAMLVTLHAVFGGVVELADWFAVYSYFFLVALGTGNVTVCHVEGELRLVVIERRLVPMLRSVAADAVIARGAVAELASMNVFGEMTRRAL